MDGPHAKVKQAAKPQPSVNEAKLFMALTVVHSTTPRIEARRAADPTTPLWTTPP